MALDSIGVREGNRNQYANNAGSTAKKGDPVITVTMKSTTPAAHAEAILKHFGMSKTDEQNFKAKYGYDLRQTLTESFAKSDNKAAHQAIGNGYFKVQIPISKEMLAQIKSVKNSPQSVPTLTPTPTNNPNETIAGRTGIDQSSQVRADLQNKLPVPQPAPTPTPVSTGTLTSVPNAGSVNGKDVSQMNLGEKLQIVFSKTLEHLGPEAAEKFKQLLTPENIAIMVGTTAALIAVQGVPFLDVAVDIAILGVAAYSLGSEALNVIGDLVDFATKTAGAHTEADLDSAGQSLAKATATVGVDALAALLLHKAVKSIKAGELPPSNTRVVEMVTPEGVRIKVRVPIEEPRNLRGANTLESRTNNSISSSSVPREAITPANVGRVTVPSVRSGQFAGWFNSLSKGEMDTLWANKTTRVKIEAALRSPGGFHEWLPVSRAPKFRQWGITAEQIWEWRSATKDLKFTNPEGRHGGAGSTTAHNEIFALIDRANSFAEFKTLLQDWATRRLPNGIADLPVGLR